MNSRAEFDKDFNSNAHKALVCSFKSSALPHIVIAGVRQFGIYCGGDKTSLQCCQLLLPVNCYLCKCVAILKSKVIGV